VIDSTPIQMQRRLGGSESRTVETLARRRGQSLSNPTTYPPDDISHGNNAQPLAFPVIGGEKTPQEDDASLSLVQQVTISASHRARRASAAEKVLEQLRSRDMQKSGSNVHSSPRPSWINFQHDNMMSSSIAHNAANATTVGTNGPVSTVGPNQSPTVGAGRSESRRQSLITPVVAPSSPVISKTTITSSRTTRPSRSPSTSQINQTTPRQIPHLTVPPGLKALLDGEHHTDELSVRFEAGWPLLEQWLRIIGGSDNVDDYGRIVIVYR